MIYTTFVSSFSDLGACAQAGVTEVLLGPELLCRESRLSKDELYELAVEANTKGLSPVLVWDVLLPEEDLNSVIDEISDWDLSVFHAVRVQDTGALHWLLEQSALSIQFIAETGNANIAGLKRWCSFIGSRLDRLVLSYQLPEEKIIEFVNELKVPCEILGAGPILLFYSPRPLLQAKIEIDESADKWLYALSKSADSHDRDFPTIENSHGTFMYLNKDQFVLDKLKGLQEAGLAAVRIDQRQISEFPNSTSNLAELLEATNNQTVTAKKHWPNTAFAPFFRRNKTTKQFDKLKPKIHELRDESCLARVLMGRKPYQMILWALRDFDVNSDEYQLALPNGSYVSAKDLQFRNMHGEILTSCKEDQLLVTNWVKRCCSGALLLEKS